MRAASAAALQTPRRVLPVEGPPQRAQLPQLRTSGEGASPCPGTMSWKKVLHPEGAEDLRDALVHGRGEHGVRPAQEHHPGLLAGDLAHLRRKRSAGQALLEGARPAVGLATTRAQGERPAAR